MLAPEGFGRRRTIGGVTATWACFRHRLRRGVVPLAPRRSERDPLDCHRCLLVGRALAGRGLALGHIRGDGSIEPHAVTEQRLLKLAGGEADLFRDPAAHLTEAYRRRARAVAARRKE